MAPIADHQGSYSDKLDIAYAGMEADLSGPRDVASRTIETAVVAFGLAVGRGVADASAMLGGTGFEGITVADKTRDADQYDVGEQAGVKRRGAIWVVASTAVDPSDPVTFTAATGVIGAGLATTIANAKFENTASIGEFVRVYLA